ncbi:hypothetical protein ANO11243_003730 [Dothideomycetidae sp. 11243]|nr:hypothetical protein ANO11243_003730 [fungal sp. No.11243]
MSDPSSPSSPSSAAWLDRRGLFQKGKELHEPGRRPSESSAAGVVDAVRRASVSSTDGLDKTASNASTSTADARRRSSNAGLFANLTQHKRGSQDYGNRRASHSDQAPAGGFLSGWYQSTFKGMQTKPNDTTAPKSGGGANGRGVME